MRSSVRSGVLPERARRGARRVNSAVLWTNSSCCVVKVDVGGVAGDDVEKLGGVVVHDVPVAGEGNPPGGVVMDAVEVRTLTSSNRIRKKAAADSVVVNRIEGAAGIVWGDFTRIDVDASLRRASDIVVIHRAAGAGTPQVDTYASAPDVVVGDFGARVARDGDIHADIAFGCGTPRHQSKAGNSCLAHAE